jgi:hypothetical protein
MRCLQHAFACCHGRSIWGCALDKAAKDEVLPAVLLHLPVVQLVDVALHLADHAKHHLLLFGNDSRRSWFIARKPLHDLWSLGPYTQFQHTFLMSSCWLSTMNKGRQQRPASEKSRSSCSLMSCTTPTCRIG